MTRMPPPPMFELGDARVLRPIEDADAPALHDAIEANRAHLTPWMPWAARQTAADTLAFVRAAHRQLADGDGFQAIIEAPHGIVGVASYRGVDRANAATSVGYWLVEAELGRGTMTCAVRALVDHAFDALALNRVEIRADVENLRSRAIPQRLGFREEGVLREAQRIGGTFRDLAVYAILAAEWRGADG